MEKKKQIYIFIGKQHHCHETNFIWFTKLFEMRPIPCQYQGCSLPGRPPPHRPASQSSLLPRCRPSRSPRSSPPHLQKQALACHWHPGQSALGVLRQRVHHTPPWEG